MHQVRIIAKNFVDMVASLPAIKLDNIYANAFICEAILRFFKVKLDDNGVGLCLLWRRKYVLQMCVDGTMSAKWMKEWVLADGAFKHKVAFDRLLQLRIFTETVDSEVLPREPLPSSITGRLPSLEKLDVFAIEQWEVQGEAYNIHPLTEVQRETIKDLADLGLVKLQQCRKECWFIPTKLATNLSMSLTDLSSRKQGFVAIETNFRIITAEQIISFLQQYAHPRVAERIPSVPENVTDQIRLWEADLNRVEMTPAHHYDEFPLREVFEGACDFAREWNCLLWEDSKEMRMVVKAEIYKKMREYRSRVKS